MVIRRRYLLTIDYVLPRLRGNVVKRCWTRKGAERYGRMWSREAWRLGYLVEATVSEISDIA